MSLAALAAAALLQTTPGPQCGAVKLLDGVCYPKIGYRDIRTNSTAECCAACHGDESCGGFTLRAHAGQVICHLKTTAMGGTSRDPECTSAVLRAPPKPKPAPKGAKNVLFIVSDDMRPSLGAYGLPEAVTPSLDKLAAEGILFTRAHVQFR